MMRYAIIKDEKVFLFVTYYSHIFSFLNVNIISSIAGDPPWWWECLFSQTPNDAA